MKKELETMKAKLMTKLALAAAVVALGLAAQAEQLYWSAYDIGSSAANPLTKAGQYIAYIFADADSGPDGAMIFANDNGKNSRVTRETIKGLLASGDTDALTSIKGYAFRNATIVKDGADATYSSDKGRLNSYNSTAGTAYYESQAVGWIGDGGYIDLFAVVFDNTSLDTASNYMFIETSEEGTINTGATEKNIQTFHFGSQENNKWYQIGTVPEPTSGILLALGVAALALKRKKAA